MNSKYYSQFRQDQFLNEVLFNNKKNGFFIDIGAHDGVTISNSLFFERHNNWDGICIEPNPNVFGKLAETRKSLNLNVCIGDANQVVKFTQIEGYSEMLSGVSDKFDARHLERINREIESKGGKKIEIDVKMIKLEDIDNIMNSAIDFISIDTEGNELDIIKSINLNNLDVKSIVIENNYNDLRINDYLSNFGFELFYKLDCDEIYVSSKYINSVVKYRLVTWKLEVLLSKVLNKFGFRKN
jgi:FkbM family methyltransferase